MKLPLRICFLNLNTLPVLFKFKSTPISHNEAFFFISFHFSHGLIKIHNFPLNHLTKMLALTYMYIQNQYNEKPENMRSVLYC